MVDITPTKLPVLVNGGMLSRYLDKINTRVHARALALGDGRERLVIVVADSCMMGRPFLDEVKALAEERTKIPANRILISATHAHSAPSSMGALGTEADTNYLPLLKEKLVETIANATAGMVPAKVGFAKIDAADYNASRQWIRRPDRLAEDPFGNFTVRANMHAAKNWDDVTGPAGPEDPDLALISVQTISGTPLAVLANFSMHYFSATDISADYFGLFAEGLKERIAPQSGFVGIMSHGCSGDIYRRNYTLTEAEWKKGQGGLTIEQYASGLLDIAMQAYQSISYRADITLAMAEQRMTLDYRLPDKQRLEWAQRIVAEMGERAPKTPTEVYAKEQIILHERKKTEIVVQAIRLGDIGIATTPNETYAITGLKIKGASPLPHNMVIELANGGDGYIPPPEQHPLGGYNTWAARSAGLEVNAEPKIAQAAISLLEKVSAQPRRPYGLTLGPASRALAELKPHAWWRLNEFTGPSAADASGNHRDAHYEPGITFYLPGPNPAAFCDAGEINRAPHFAGGRLRARLPELGQRYTLSLWLWNGMPNEGRDVSGWLFSRDHDSGLSAYGEHLGIGGKSGSTGKLIFLSGTQTMAGKTEIPRWQWQHVALARDGEKLLVYLNGKPEIEASAPPSAIENCAIGGRSDNDSNWEGRLDEVAIFDRVLSAAEIQRLALK